MGNVFHPCCDQGLQADSDKPLNDGKATVAYLPTGAYDEHAQSFKPESGTIEKPPIEDPEKKPAPAPRASQTAGGDQAPAQRKSVTARRQSLTHQIPPPEDRKTQADEKKIAARNDSEFGPSNAKAVELCRLLHYVRVEEARKDGDKDQEEIERQREEAKKLIAEGQKPCVASMVFLHMDVDGNETLDRYELGSALGLLVPDFDDFNFNFKVSELYSEGDGWLDLDEWLEIVEEIPALRQALEATPFCQQWKKVLQPKAK